MKIINATRWSAFIKLVICGVLFGFCSSIMATTISTRIVGGNDVAPSNEYSWMASLQYSSSGKHFCGATLIDARWLLTAAHCVQNKRPSGIRVQIGVTQLYGQFKPRYKVKSINIHPDYNFDTQDSDLALLELEQQVSESPVAIISSAEFNGLDENKKMNVIGWGSISPDRNKPIFKRTLQKVELPRLENSLCRQSFPVVSNLVTAITDNMFCLGYQAGGKDSCYGDSGGPAFIQDIKGRYVQTGVVSFGYECAQPNHYGVYVKLSKFKTWIEQQIQGLAFEQSHKLLSIAPINKVLNADFELINRSDESKSLDLDRSLIEANQIQEARLFNLNCPNVLESNQRCRIRLQTRMGKNSGYPFYVKVKVGGKQDLGINFSGHLAGYVDAYPGRYLKFEWFTSNKRPIWTVVKENALFSSDLRAAKLSEALLWIENIDVIALDWRVLSNNQSIFFQIETPDGEVLKREITSKNTPYSEFVYNNLQGHKYLRFIAQAGITKQNLQYNRIEVIEKSAEFKLNAAPKIEKSTSTGSGSKAGVLGLPFISLLIVLIIGYRKYE